MKYTPQDIENTRRVILDELIDEMVRTSRAKNLHPVDRVAALQLTLDLEGIRNESFDSEYRHAQAMLMEDSNQKPKDNE